MRKFLTIKVTVKKTREWADLQDSFEDIDAQTTALSIEHHDLRIESQVYIPEKPIPSGIEHAKIFRTLSYAVMGRGPA